MDIRIRRAFLLEKKRDFHALYSYLKAGSKTKEEDPGTNPYENRMT